MLSCIHGVAPLRVNSQVLTKDEDNIHAFNVYFCSVFTTLSSIVISLSANKSHTLQQMLTLLPMKPCVELIIL